MKHVTIFCDGSSIGNGKGVAKAAAVAILEFQGKRKIVGEYLGNNTNQQAEVVAAALGLETLKEPCSVTLTSDSQYVVQTMLGNFRRKTNHEFWERLDKAARRHKVSWNWTRGHAGHPVQELCDEAAQLIARTGAVDQDAINKIIAS